MKNNFKSAFTASILFVGLIMFPVVASGPELSSVSPLNAPSESPLWQNLFVERKAMEKFPVAIIGQSVDIKEPFSVQIQRTLQILMTRKAYWTPGRIEPKDDDILYSASFECGITRQHWPVKTFFDDSCSNAKIQSAWLTDGGVLVLTELLNHYWNRSPRVHYTLLQTSQWDRQEDIQPLKTDIHLKATLVLTFGDLRKLSAYFFSHRMITDKKLNEFPKLRNRLESYYAYGEIPIPLEE